MGIRLVKRHLWAHEGFPVFSLTQEKEVLFNASFVAIWLCCDMFDLNNGHKNEQLYITSEVGVVYGV